MQLLQGQSHGVTLPAVPCILLVKFLWLREDLQTIMEGGIAIDVPILVLVLDGQRLAEVDLELYLFVALGEEVGEGAVEGFWEVATVAFFVAELAHVARSLEVVYVHFDAYFLGEGF